MASTAIFVRAMKTYVFYILFHLFHIFTGNRKAMKQGEILNGGFPDG